MKAKIYYKAVVCLRLSREDASTKVLRGRKHKVTVSARRAIGNGGILSPMEYKRLRGEKFQTGFATAVKTKWEVTR